MLLLRVFLASKVDAITFEIAANSPFPGNTAADLIRIAKENPGKIDYASGNKLLKLTYLH
jgi:tripartite-type tricarboxylate transporter receptor subunit TctC